MAIQFIFYNFLPGLFIGLLVWLFVVIALKLLPIRDPLLRLGLLSLPIVKSALVLLGWHTMLPWPGRFFGQIQAQALPLRQSWPIIMSWATLLLLLYFIFFWRLRRRLLSQSQPVANGSDRLAKALACVTQRLAQRPLSHCPPLLCSISQNIPDVELRYSETISSPLALTEGARPLILWPARLSDHLLDEEIFAILAHELGHFLLRRPRWCSTTLFRRMAVISPVAALVGAQLNWEEELACDDIALDVVARPDVYATALLKSFRFARQAPQPVYTWLQPLPRLLGSRPLLTQRIERVLNLPMETASSTRQFVATGLLTATTILLFFSTT